MNSGKNQPHFENVRSERDGFQTWSRGVSGFSSRSNKELEEELEEEELEEELEEEELEEEELEELEELEEDAYIWQR